MKQPSKEQGLRPQRSVSRKREEEFEAYEKAGITFAGNNQREEVDFVTGDELVTREDTAEIDNPAHPAQDLRFGGSDISSVSEWSMRARSPELDDGLDAGDFKRADKEILDEVWKALGNKADEIKELEIFVRAGEVYLRGRVKHRAQRDQIEDLLLDVPGVRNVHDEMIVVAGP